MKVITIILAVALITFSFIQLSFCTDEIELTDVPACSSANTVFAEKQPQLNNSNDSKPEVDGVHETIVICEIDPPAARSFVKPRARRNWPKISMRDVEEVLYSPMIRIILGLEIINAAFSYGWVIGFARSLENPFLRSFIPKFFYALFMVLFNVGTLLVQRWSLKSVFPLKDSDLDALAKFSLFLFQAAHIGAPFIATRIVQEVDWQNACKSWSESIQYDPSGVMTLNGTPIAQIGITDPNNDITQITFQGLSPMFAFQQASLTIGRDGNGNISGDCYNQPGCIKGTFQAKVNSPISLSFQVDPNIAEILHTGPDNSWWENPIVLTDDKNGSIQSLTFPSPTGSSVKICSNNDYDALMTSLVVPFQGKGQQCDSCWNQCTNCCNQVCYLQASTSSSCSNGRCTSSTTYHTVCNCIGCSVSQCQVTCLNDCKGILMA